MTKIDKVKGTNFNGRKQKKKMLKNFMMQKIHKKSKKKRKKEEEKVCVERMSSTSLIFLKFFMSACMQYKINKLLKKVRVCVLRLANHSCCTVPKAN